ncbi:MAG: GAF domain-containing protein [bacterium]
MQNFSHLIDKITVIVDNNLERDGKLKDICKLLKDNIPHYNWVGFYIAENSKPELILGPYIGTPTEHTKIPFGKGICGQAAERKETFVVQDVSKETNYLSCNINVKSEIVVPIFKDNKIVGELDIDSHATSPFTKEDKDFLENICKIISKVF